MVKKDNDIRVRRTKRLIRKGICELAKEKSLNKITVKELTDLIEINRGTFYLHYKDISDFVTSVKSELYEEFDVISSNITNNMIYDNPSDILERICMFINDNADICGMLIGPNGDASFAYEFGTIINDRCFEIFLGIYPDINKDRYSLIYEYCKSGAVGLIRHWIAHNHELSSREVATLWMSLLKSGLDGILEEEVRGYFK